MLQKPKDPIQMKQQTEKNHKKQRGKQIPQPEKNQLQETSFASNHVLSRKPKSLVKKTKNTTLTLKSRMGFTKNGSRKNPFIEKIAALPKPKAKNGQRLNFSSELASGCEKSGVELRCIEQEKVSGELINVKEFGNDLNVKAENVTPVNKCLGVFEDLNGSCKSNSEVKTPPIEASVSPEIQFGASDLLHSVATPAVCYGTGHVLSGVTDRRKCRSRGILTVGDALDYRLGSGKDINGNNCDYSFDGEVNERVKESGFLIPLPVEASVKWLLSPCDENCGSPNGDSSGKVMNLGDVEGSCPSVCIGSDSDLVCDSSEHVRGILRRSIDSGKTCRASPRRFYEFEGDFLSNGLVKEDKKGFCRSITEEKSPFSIGSLSSGNVIQTPNSDYTSEENRGGCWSEMSEHGTCTFKPEVDSEARILGRERSILDPPGLSFQSNDLSSSSCSVDLQKNFDNHASLLSVSSIDNMSQSHMRISWRDLLASRSSDMDELDCCRCLSDEDISDDESLKLGDECRSGRENGKSAGSPCKSPECIKHEIAFPLRKKEKCSPYKHKSCAESISTDGGGLAASEDFD